MSVEKSNNMQISRPDESWCDDIAAVNEIHIDSPQMARKRLVDFFDVLLEMHTEYKRNHKGVENDEDPLLSLHPRAEAKNKCNP